MNRHVNSIAGRLSLRPPQRRSLEILDRVTEIVPPRKKGSIEEALAAIRSEYRGVTDFEREFPSLCFALATGVGKTRLMGAFISYLHLAHGINNFFILAPNLTVYNKIVTDFTPNTPKYVFAGIAEFVTDTPEIITGDNYESRAGSLFDEFARCKVNIFNISKINAEVRGGKSPRIKRLSEYIGESYFDYLANLSDLVLLMDESHRYRASAGVRAINELKPILGLELTATPFVETNRGPVAFKNVIFDYPLGKAMADGFVKEPAVVTQKNFDPSQFSPTQIEEIKLQDGIRLHENTKVELETYARQAGAEIVKPFMLIIARDTTHAGQLMSLIQSDAFFEGRYKERVIQVDSSRTGAEEDLMVQRLLKVERRDDPTEIVIHVNMLKEGWDVTNLYTIVPLRAANARILIEQSIGRGLRLPFGRRTGVSSVDRLNIIAHDRFQEILDEANRPDSVIRLTQVVLDPATDLQKSRTVVVQTNVGRQILGPLKTVPSILSGKEDSAPSIFQNEHERQIAEATWNVIRKNESLRTSKHLLDPEVQQRIVDEVAANIVPSQPMLEGLIEQPDIKQVVAKTTEFVIQQTIDIPRILVLPKGEVSTGFHSFTLDCSNVRYQPVERDLLIEHLRTHARETMTFVRGGQHEVRLEDYLVRALIDFDDIAYDEHSVLLYDVAGQMVNHLRSYLSEEDSRNVLIYHQKQLAGFIHAQMLVHQWEKTTGYDIEVSKGFTELKEPAYTVKEGDIVYDLHTAVDKSKIPQMFFGNFRRCLYPVQKFQSDPERQLAIILDRETEKWFKPVNGQIWIFYKLGNDHREYNPDFVAEERDFIYMLEVKARNELETAEVVAKKQAALQWCGRASEHARSNHGKPWKYALIPHDAVSENMTLAALVAHFSPL